LRTPKTRQTNPPVSESLLRQRASKTHQDYWKNRLKRRSHVNRQGVRAEVSIRRFDAKFASCSDKRGVKNVRKTYMSPTTCKEKRHFLYMSG